MFETKGLPILARGGHLRDLSELRLQLLRQSVAVLLHERLLERVHNLRVPPRHLLREHARSGLSPDPTVPFGVRMGAAASMLHFAKSACAAAYFSASERSGFADV